MSIASEITRLQGVKADILTAIGNKGVTVPAGSALDDCPALIRQVAGVGGIGHRTGTTHYGWFLTDGFNLSSANKIEENIVCKADSFNSGYQFQICGGQWYSGDSTFYGIAVYIWADKIEYDDKNGTEHYFNDIPYSFTNWIRKNIVYDKVARAIYLKIYYDDTLVLNEQLSIDLAQFSSSVHYHIGGNRLGDVTSFDGDINFSKSYIKLDDELVWGMDQ